MKPSPWVCAALMVLAVQIFSPVVTVSAQSGSFVRPHDVQGPGAMSPHAGNTLTVRGVITANLSSSFFIQTESGLEDADPNTSEGLLILAPPSAGAGSIVHVTGTVEEFADFGAGTVTRLGDVTEVLEVGTVNALPAPIPLAPAAPPEQLERFEGMRVTATLRSISGTDLDGVFYAVLHDSTSEDTARPFREPGIEAGAPELACAIGPCAFDSFDGNPERLRVDMDRLAGTMATDLSTGSVVTDVDGLLHFESGVYAFFPESNLQPSNGMTMRAAPAAGAAEYSIASLNLGGDPEDVEAQLIKASLMVRSMLNTPDIIGVQQAIPETLEALGPWIDADAVDAGETAPGYVAHLGGFLVKASRVTVVSAAAVGGDEVFEGEPLFDRAPVQLRAVVNGAPGTVPQLISVLNGEVYSNVDVGRADEDGVYARARRLEQAQWLARFVQTRNDLNDALVVVGHFNAHAFNDGSVDVMGTVSGAPASPDQVVLESADLVTPDLVNLAGGLPDGERYNSVERGNAELLDHTLVSQNLLAQVRSFALARVNADFPESLRFWFDTPSGLSDRDPSVAYFAFPPDSTAPVFSGTPQSQVLQATGPSGAVATYTAPTAADNLDGSVPVTCGPASGSTFPVGVTTVECSASDSAGNVGTVQFTVTVTGVDPSPAQGRMHGIGLLKTSANRVTFAFDVKRASNSVQQGWLILSASDSRGRNHQCLFTAYVRDVRFSDPRGTVTFSGSAVWNGRSGYRVEVTARDNGSRGDTFSIKVRAPNGSVVLSASGVISDGKIQQTR